MSELHGWPNSRGQVIILKSLEEALTEEMVKVAVHKALEKHRVEQGSQLEGITGIERELSLIEAHERNLVDAIAKGHAVDPLLKQLEVEEGRKHELIKKLEELKASKTLGSLDEVRLKRELKSRLADLNGLLRRHISGARRLLKILLDQPLRLETIEDGGGRLYRILGTGNYLPLLENIKEPMLPSAWCPQRGKPHQGV